eukprot:scaffold2114_cov142-Skeletonema_dohrnii-CCMP3373.AAC.2
MVTRSVILVTPSEAAAFAATSTLSSSLSADSVINNVHAEQNSTEELQTNSFNYSSYKKPARNPSPGGLVQLCRHKGCINEVDFERGGGLCYIHQKVPMDGEQCSSDDASENDGKIRGVARDEYCLDAGLSDRHSTYGNNYGLDEVGNKHDRPSEDSISGKDDITKRQRVDAFVLDLTGVPPQSPIPRSAGHIKEGASKYKGVSFDKTAKNKWRAQIMIDGMNRHIGYYENEEEAAADYARAVFKYKGQGALEKARERRAQDNSGELNSVIIDLSDVPPQPPLPKSAGHIKEGASKYTGVSFNKPKKKWQAQIEIEGKTRRIGHYENEEEAGSDYARAVVKYKGQEALDRARGQDSFIIDLIDVPPQSPIPKSAGRIREGASKYVGVSFNKPTKKWLAQISIDGKNRHIGYYENEEESAVDYARAVFKYKGAVYANCRSNSKEKKNQPRDLDEVGKKRVRPSEESISGKDDNKRQRVDAFIIDLSDVPPQPPIPKSVGHIIKEGASKYKGVSFDKRRNKWRALIRIDGKARFIGYYENEEEAAADYARAVFKYKNQAALGKAREQDLFIIDLTDVPPQSPILKSAGRIREGASKYVGVSFNKSMNKWQAQISIDGKQ